MHVFAVLLKAARVLEVIDLHRTDEAATVAATTAAPSTVDTTATPLYSAAQRKTSSKKAHGGAKAKVTGQPARLKAKLKATAARDAKHDQLNEHEMSRLRRVFNHIIMESMGEKGAPKDVVEIFVIASWMGDGHRCERSCFSCATKR
jgi:hypothetical protein